MELPRLAYKGSGRWIGLLEQLGSLQEVFHKKGGVSTKELIVGIWKKASC